MGVARAGARAAGAVTIAWVMVLGSGCVVDPPPPNLEPVDDPALIALDVVPAGAFTTPSWADVGREARMYDSLTPLGGDITEADVDQGFKPAGLGFPAGQRAREVERPRAGIEIKRDEFNVPHVVADSDLKAVWAVGWLSATHSPIVYDAARRNGRIAAMGVPGGDAIGSAFGFRILEPSAQAEAALQRQIDELMATDEGRLVVDDIDAFVAGYNARLDATLSILPRWTRLDVVALSAFKAEWWGRGGTEYPPYEPWPDPEPTVTLGGDVDLPTRYRAAKASNFALVAGDRSATGHPLLIGGPQIGYMYPGIAFEVDIHSPGIRMRGLTAPAYPGYVFVGRGEDFAWTINVAFDAVTGQVAPIEMCGDGWSFYVLDGECVAVEEVPVGTRYSLADPTTPPEQVVLRTTAFGPIDVFGAFGDTGYVIQRPGVGHDVQDLIGFRAVNRGEARGPVAFRAAMQRSPQAFYAGYVDDEHIAAFGTCWCARRSADGRPVLDQQELLVPVADLPSTVDPTNGVITNWNEPLVTPGGDFEPPALEEFRGDWFEVFDRVPVHTRRSLVGAMNDMATRWVWPGSTTEFLDVLPPADGFRPGPIRSTNRSTAIQMVMSFGPADR